MMIVSQFRQLNLSVVNVRTYLFAVLFVGGNMLLPQLCHLMPDGLFFSGSFERCPEAVKVKPSFILVHSHITLYHSTFLVEL